MKIMKCLKRKKLSKVQLETIAKGCENIGTMVIGGILLQWFLDKAPVDLHRSGCLLCRSNLAQE
jgi:hypothetical protein